MKNWFSIRNASDTVAEVSLYDEIGAWGITAKDFISALKQVGNRRIQLHINSPGGDVFDGTAIYNRLKSHAGGVEVVIDGLAASMASIIAMAGDPVIMPANAFMMIHNPAGVVMGEAEEMRETADLLDKVRGQLVGAYAQKTGLSEDELIEMMDAETWMTAQEALVKGFCDQIGDAVQIAASFDTRRFRNAPKPQPQNPPNMILRAAILTALSLTETADKPLSDTQIMAEFNRSLGLATLAVGELSTVRASLATAQGQLTTVQGQLTTAQNDLTTVRGQLTTAQSEAQTAKDQRTQFINAIKAGLQLSDEQVGKIDTAMITAALEKIGMNKAVEIAASQGVPPLLKDLAADAPNTMTLAEYEGLNPKAKHQFIMKGGKLTS